MARDLLDPSQQHYRPAFDLSHQACPQQYDQEQIRNERLRAPGVRLRRVRGGVHHSAARQVGPLAGATALVGRQCQGQDALSVPPDLSAQRQRWGSVARRRRQARRPARAVAGLAPRRLPRSLAPSSREEIFTLKAPPDGRR